jgi:hypothetical protein
VPDASPQQGALQVGELSPQIVHVGRFEWERLIRRLRLGFYSGKTKDPKRWVRASTVQQVALAAATYGNLDGTRIRPPVKRLARVCELDEKTVRICLQRLRRVNLLEQVSPARSPGRSGGPGRAAEYRMTYPEDLLDRVAYLDPEEKELIVPAGIDLGPERKPRRRGGSDAATWTSGGASVVEEHLTAP